MSDSDGMDFNDMTPHEMLDSPRHLSENFRMLWWGRKYPSRPGVMVGAVPRVEYTLLARTRRI